MPASSASADDNPALVLIPFWGGHGGLFKYHVDGGDEHGLLRYIAFLDPFLPNYRTSTPVFNYHRDSNQQSTNNSHEAYPRNP